jgi:hypothetical protein
MKKTLSRPMTDHLSQAVVLANKDFNLEIAASQVSTTGDFKKSLTRLIGHLLNNDFERLINGLYRIDVSEEKVKWALASGDDVAEQIALLIIDREMEKVITREKYRQDKNIN